MWTWTHMITAAHIEPPYTPQWHTPIHIYTTQVKSGCIYLARHPQLGTPPHSDDHTTTLITKGLRTPVHYSHTTADTDTHAQGGKMSTCHGWTHQGQAKCQAGLNHPFFIQVHTSSSNIEPYSYLLTTMTYFTYIHTSCAPTVILPTILGFYWLTCYMHQQAHRPL